MCASNRPASSTCAACRAWPILASRRATPSRHSITHTSTGSGRTEGFADVWLKGHFTRENKALGKSLDGALKPLMS